jgi:hypothetical protein
MALIAHAAMQIPDFRTVTMTKYYQFPGKMPAAGHTRSTFQIYTENRLLRHNFKGVAGGKTGFTSLAHRTFWGAAERNGHLLVATLFQIHEPTETAAEHLLNWGFANLGKVAPVGTLVAPVKADSSSSTSPGSSAPSATAAGQRRRGRAGGRHVDHVAPHAAVAGPRGRGRHGRRAGLGAVATALERRRTHARRPARGAAGAGTARIRAARSPPCGGTARLVGRRGLPRGSACRTEPGSRRRRAGACGRARGRAGRRASGSGVAARRHRASAHRRKQRARRATSVAPRGLTSAATRRRRPTARAGTSAAGSSRRRRARRARRRAPRTSP